MAGEVLPRDAITDGMVVEVVSPNGILGTVRVEDVAEALHVGYHFATPAEHAASIAKQEQREHDDTLATVGLIGGGVVGLALVVLALAKARSAMVRTLVGVLGAIGAFAIGGPAPALIIGVGALLWVAYAWRTPPLSPPPLPPITGGEPTGIQKRIAEIEAKRRRR
jgi:hypothetical protein